MHIDAAAVAAQHIEHEPERYAAHGRYHRLYGIAFWKSRDGRAFACTSVTGNGLVESFAPWREASRG
jgi:hypothetical protein